MGGPVASPSAFQDPDQLSWRRVALLVAAMVAVFGVVLLVNMMVSELMPRPNMANDVSAASLVVVGAAIMAAGLTRSRRYPGELFAAAGLIMWCIAAMSGADLRTWLSLPAFVLAWGSLAIRLAPDTRIAIFVAHLMPMDAILDDLGLETGAGNLTGILAATYLLALLFALPVDGPWRNAVAGFAGCAVVVAVIAGVGYGTWTWRIGVYFLAVLAYGALVFLAWKARKVLPWEPFALRRTPAAPVAAAPDPPAPPAPAPKRAKARGTGTRR